MTNGVSIDVPEDSLAAAIAGTERGERWEHAGWQLEISMTHGVRLAEGRFTRNPPIDGYARAEEPLTCPRVRCGGEPEIEAAIDTYGVMCPICGLVDWNHGMGYPTEAEARAAWKRIGGKR